MTTRAIKICIAIFTLGFLSACEGVVTDDREETGSKGSIKIAVDETLQPVMEQQLKIWDSSYPEGHVTPIYTSEKGAFEELFKDSVRLIIATRDITEAEKKAGETRKIAYASSRLSKDAVAIIVHPSAVDNKMTMGMLANILENKFPRKYKIIFDNPKSGLVRMIQDSVLHGRTISDNTVFAAGSPEKVLAYVAENKDALGIIGINYIYNNNDSTGVPKFKTNIQVVALQAESDTTNQYFQPYAANLALNRYPLTRTIYFITRERWRGLGTGFATFLSQPPGQMIFKKANMVPLLTQLEIHEVIINEQH